jgi:hypothetical protein
VIHVTDEDGALPSYGRVLGSLGIAVGFSMRGLGVMVGLVRTACIVMLMLAMQSIAASAGVVLITPEEARLPNSKDVFASRAITRGPRIDLSSLDAGALHSPLRLQLTFRGFGGATIDPASLRVTYLKLPNVDLTPRVRPYLQSTGIEIPEAEAPPGEHLVRVEIHDSEGRRTVTTFMLSVAP